MLQNNDTHNLLKSLRAIIDLIRKNRIDEAEQAMTNLRATTDDATLPDDAYFLLLAVVDCLKGDPSQDLDTVDTEIKEYIEKTI